MDQTYTVRHNEHITENSFESVVQLFEAATGSVEGERWQEVAAPSDREKFETSVHKHEGSSGFIRFLTIDHGWMTLYGVNAHARMYTIGNPLIARTMLQHSIAAGLNVPIRLLIYEHQASGTTRLAYDLPSSLMSVLGDERVTQAAEALDAKLIALAVRVTGADA